MVEDMLQMIKIWMLPAEKSILDSIINPLKKISENQNSFEKFKIFRKQKRIFKN